MGEQGRSIFVDIQVSFPNGNALSRGEDYSEYLARTGATTNSIVVEYWTEDGGSAIDEEGKTFASATAGQDYKPLRGTLTFTQGSRSGWEYTPAPRHRTVIEDVPDVYWFGREHHKKSIFFPIFHDNVDELTGQFTVKARIRSSNNDNASGQIFERAILIVDDEETVPAPVTNVDSPPLQPIVTSTPSAGASLMFRPTSLSLSESGSATYQVRATASQNRNMIVNIATTHTGITINPNRLTFNSYNWQTYQTVTVTASADASDISEQASIRHSIPGSEGFAAINDAGIVSITLAPTIVEEPNGEDMIEPEPVDPEPEPPTNSEPVDYDQDDDGLIEVSNLAQLNAIRFDLNGDGQPDQEAFADAYSQAFPSAIANMGIPNNAPAQGYELTSDLDFDTNHNGHAEEADAFWNKGHGWQSIGLFAHPFQAVLAGNGHTIHNLFQDQSDASRFAGKPSGLLGALGNRGQVVGLGLEEVDIKGVNWVGAIAGLSQGVISHCSVSGQVVGSNSVGGLVGHNFGNIAHSFVNAEVSGVVGVSVFVGWNVGGSIESSSAQGRVNGATSAGDLVGLGTPAR